MMMRPRRRAMPAMPAVMMTAIVTVLVDGRAYQRADTGSQQGADERMPIHGGCADGADASAYGGSGKGGMMAWPAGHERETEYADEAESKDAAHSILLVRSMKLARGYSRAVWTQGMSRPGDMLARRFALFAVRRDRRAASAV
jgi:hypothetical protein